MRKTTAIAATLLALGAAVAPTASALAAPTDVDQGPEVAWVNDNVVVSADRSQAEVLAKFRCFGGEEGTHLWISAKQGENLQQEGSSQWATSWYDTNYQYAEDPAGQTIDCDGQWHTQKFVIKQVGGWGRLTKGTAWVQFCVFDNHGGFGSFNSYKDIRIGS